MLSNRIAKIVLGVFATIFLSIFVLDSGVFAATAYKNYQTKALGYGIYNCYVKAQAKNSWTVSPDTTLDAYRNSGLGGIIKTQPSDYVPIYTDNKKLNCNKFIGSLLTDRGLSTGANLTDDQIKVVLTNLGYKGISGGDCFSIRSEYWGEEWERLGQPFKESTSAMICSSDGTVSAKSVSVYGENNGFIRMDKGEGMVNVLINVPDIAGGYINLPYRLDKGAYSDFATLRKTIITDLTNIFSNNPVDAEGNRIDFEDVIGVDISKYNPYKSGNQLCLNFSEWNSYLCVDQTKMYNVGEYITGYTIDKVEIGATRAGAAFDAAKNLLGNGSFNSMSSFKFTPEDKYALYEYYLLDFYSAKKTCADDDGVDWEKVKKALQSDDGASVYKPTASGPVECYVVPQKHKKQKVNGVNSNEVSTHFMYFDGTEVGLSEVLDGTDVSKIPNFSMEELEKALEENEVNPVDPDSGEEITPSAAADGCYAAGLDSQAWVLCPTLANMTSVADGLDDLVSGMLSVNTNYFNEGGKTEYVWGIFRDIANVIMVIILLVIIFSQLTGYGIDNYGIKKMLPKLILMAILIGFAAHIPEQLI